MYRISKLRSCLLVAAISSFSSGMAVADMFQPSHSCIKPYKPFQFKSQYEVDSFNDDVQRYKQCISDFVEEQNDAMRKHSDAADDAISDWNNFVNYELN
ncbi:hypothetical protein [Vibrio aestuarianus]|uniref:Uncharacterized protein n=1 Tax=Vibrio aestuarianus TaxID=28171 RepID=A0A9X4FAX3_9VIBR|nr:hypothetical protein [Vibrio aestuarianus]MDE1348266.1 hypothetical protein [Vibrio aestuarianus]